MKAVTRKMLPEETRELCSRIKSLRRMLKISQTDFSRSVGISQGHLCTIERCEQSPSKTFMLAICCRYNVNEDWLVLGEGEPFQPVLEERGIPVYTRFPDFFTKPNDFEVLGYISLPGFSKDAFALLQRGDFMAPTIHANDIVVCDPTFDKISNDDLLLIKNKWGTYLIRRYRMIGDTPMLSPDNSLYKPFPMSREMAIAKVVKVFREINF